MPTRITPAQVRGARALVDWSMLDLAVAARVSVSTVKRVEHGDKQPVSDATFGMIQDALESEGLSFLPDDGNGPGVRRRGR